MLVTGARPAEVFGVQSSMEGSYLLLTLLAGAAAGCQLSGPLDLGRPLSANMLRIDESMTPFQSGNLQTGEYYGVRYFNNDFCSGEHTGTHLDAPYHFNESAWTVDQIPLERLVANGVFLNVTEEVAGNVSFRLQPSHIDQWVARNGPFPDNAVLLVSYGWAQLFHNHTLYKGTASSAFRDFRFPGVSREAVDRLAQIDQLVGFGIDTPSVDPIDHGHAHVTLAAKNIYNLEQVNLDQPCLPARGFKVFSMPVNIVGGTGAPVRIVAVPDCAAR